MANKINSDFGVMNIIFVTAYIFLFSIQKLFFLLKC